MSNKEEFYPTGGGTSVRRVTICGSGSLYATLPRFICRQLNINRGDYVNITTDGEKIIIQKYETTKS